MFIVQLIWYFGIIGPKFDQILAWPHRGYRWAVGVHDPLKSFFMGTSLLDNFYLENKFTNKSGWPNPHPLREIDQGFQTSTENCSEYTPL